MTFPYSPSHDRAKFALQLKDKEIYKKMLDHYRLKNLFKCMAYSCMFSSDSAADFTNHLEWHSKRYFTPNLNQPIPEHRILPENGDHRPYIGETLTLPDFYLCSCCPFGATSPAELTEHVELIHSRSLFQCSTCFFRAHRSKMVNIHATICHPGNNRAFTLVCKQIAPNKPEIPTEQLRLAQVPRYRCPVGDCGFTCILPISLIQHLSTVHAEVKHFNCRQCGEKFVGNSYYTKLFSHMNVHEVGFFQCAFCLWGTEQPIDALIHLCLHHPSLDGKVLTRSLQPNPLTPKTLSKFWAPGAYSSTFKMSLDRKYIDLFDRVVIIEDGLTPEEEVVIITTDVAQENVVQEEAEKEDGTVNTKEPEFYGFEEEELIETKKMVECIVIESDSEEGSVPEEPLAISPPFEEDVEQESDEKVEGLYGRELYRCGNIGCDETAETVDDFKVCMQRV